MNFVPWPKFFMRETETIEPVALKVLDSKFRAARSEGFCRCGAIPRTYI